MTIVAPIRAATVYALVACLLVAAGPSAILHSAFAQSTKEPATKAPSSKEPGGKDAGGKPTADKPRDLSSLMGQITQLFTAGKYAEAIPVAERIVAAVEAMGGGQLPIQAQNFSMLGDLHRFTGNFAEADANYGRALEMLERIHKAEPPPGHADLMSPLLGLHHLRATQGRFKEAATFLARAVRIRERVSKPDDPELAWIRVTQAKLAQETGRPDLAAPQLERALAVMTAKLAPGHPYIGATKNNLAQAYIALGRYREAEPLMQQAVAETAKVAGATSPLHAVALNNLASLFRLQGRLLEAEDLHRRELQIVEAAIGPDNIGVVASLNNLALALDALQRPREAEPLLRRALAIQLKHLAPNHPDIAKTTGNLATIVGHDGRRDEARVLLERSLKLRDEAHGSRSPEVAVALQNLSALLFEDKRNDEALAFAKRALSILEGSLPANHPAIGQALNNIGSALDALGRHREATGRLEHAVAHREAGLGRDHPETLTSLVNLAANALDLEQWPRAYEIAGRVIRAYEDSLVEVASAQASDAATDGSIARIRGAYLIRAVAADQLRTAPGQDAAALIAEAFVALQGEQASATGAALKAASLRAAAADPALAALVRERQDIGEQWRARNRQAIEALGKLPTERDPTAEMAIREDAARLAAEARALDRRLTEAFPAHASLARPTPLSLADAQRALAPEDALLVVAPTRLGAMVFAVTREDATFVRSRLSGADIEAAVRRLRCGLDVTLWNAEPTLSECLKLAKPRRVGELPFDLDAAHALYKGLLGDVADVIAGKRLRIVATGPLSTLPFQVLVTAPPVAGVDPAQAMRQAAWLVRRHAIAVLPSVDSLIRLRPQTTATSAATSTASSPAKPYLAVANPLLTGPEGTDTRAFAKQSCRQTLLAGGIDAAAVRAARSAVLGLAVPSTAVGGGNGAAPAPSTTPASAPVTRAVPRPSLDIESLRRQTPLPETADEVCTVAKLLGAGEDDVLLGERATLPSIRDLGRRGLLDDYRVLHFASHGFVAGGGSSLERGLPEPAILLTPPPTGTTGAKLAEDNGLLAASDIAALRLDADWVVLSACNTASGGRAGAEALSGLARAFFFAGARGMLVSHWEVYSDAAVKLVTRAFEVFANAPEKGRAGALAVAMSELAASEDPFIAHPAY